jgi:hypothetical protein
MRISIWPDSHRRGPRDEANAVLTVPGWWQADGCVEQGRKAWQQILHEIGRDRGQAGARRRRARCCPEDVMAIAHECNGMAGKIPQHRP